MMYESNVVYFNMYKKTVGKQSPNMTRSYLIMTV